MFRIKTDIRQFNCETREKVEKLIRSWVIRPTDLMLDDAQQTWSPIGEHDEFAQIFEQLREVSDVEIVDENEPNDSPEVIPVEAESTASAQILSGHGMLKLRALANEESDPLPIPVAPEGVEPVVVSDELTIMTERTADLLGVLDDAHDEVEEPEVEEPKLEDASSVSEVDDAELPVPVAPKGVEPAAPSEEATQIFERDEEEEDSESPEDSQEGYELEEVSKPSTESEDLEEESEPRMGRHDLPEELFLTSEISRSELISPLEPVMDDLRNADSSVDDDEETEAWEVTQQIESPLESSEELPLPDEPGEGLDLALSEAAESDIHSEWENMMELDELRETDEFDVADHIDALTSFETPEEDIRETIELDSPVSLSEVSEQEQPEGPVGISSKVIVDMPEASEETSDRDVAAFGLDDTADFHTDELFDSETAPPPSLEESAEDETLDEFTPEIPEDAHIVVSEEQDIDDITEVQVEGESFMPSEDFVSEGYTLPLPFAITPSADDLRQGVQHSTATDQEKDRHFPRPRPKKLGELSTHRYGFGDAPRVQPAVPVATRIQASPKDYSRIVAIIVLILVVLVVASLIIIFD